MNTRKGFTVPEVIIVVACIAVISTISFGNLYRLFDKQKKENEKFALSQIQKAMEVYADRESKLPEISNWYDELAKYSNLSPNQIRYDEMGEERVYLHRTNRETFLSGMYFYNIHYASVLSKGINKSPETSNWSSVTTFSNYNAQGDDILIKFTDYDIKVKKHKETLERVKTLEKYLERYARSKRSIARSKSVSDVDDFDQKIFYPKDGRGGDGGSYFTGTDGVDTLDTPMEAISLAKILGLPESTGEDAITGKTMWYISNPGITDILRPCDNEKSNAPFYPPRIFLRTSSGSAPAGC